ncbi:MAG: hypothetical protein SGCHY_003393 [Lobulomycetales sp.]
MDDANSSESSDLFCWFPFASSSQQLLPEKLVSPPFGPPTARTQAVLLIHATDSPLVSFSHSVSDSSSVSFSRSVSLYIRPVKSARELALGDAWERSISLVDFALYPHQSAEPLATASFTSPDIIGFKGGSGTGFGVPDFCCLAELPSASFMVRINIVLDIQKVSHDVQCTELSIQLPPHNPSMPLAFPPTWREFGSGRNAWVVSAQPSDTLTFTGISVTISPVFTDFECRMLRSAWNRPVSLITAGLFPVATAAGHLPPGKPICKSLSGLTMFDASSPCLQLDLDIGDSCLQQDWTLKVSMLQDLDYCIPFALDSMTTALEGMRINVSRLTQRLKSFPQSSSLGSSSDSRHSNNLDQTDVGRFTYPGGEQQSDLQQQHHMDQTNASHFTYPGGEQQPNSQQQQHMNQTNARQFAYPEEQQPESHHHMDMRQYTRVAADDLDSVSTIEDQDSEDLTELLSSANSLLAPGLSSLGKSGDRVLTDSIAPGVSPLSKSGDGVLADSILVANAATLYAELQVARLPFMEEYHKLGEEAVSQDRRALLRSIEECCAGLLDVLIQSNSRHAPVIPLVPMRGWTQSPDAFNTFDASMSQSTLTFSPNTSYAVQHDDTVYEPHHSPDASRYQYSLEQVASRPLETRGSDMKPSRPPIETWGALPPLRQRRAQSSSTTISSLLWILVIFLASSVVFIRLPSDTFASKTDPLAAEIELYQTELRNILHGEVGGVFLACRHIYMLGEKISVADFTFTGLSKHTEVPFAQVALESGPMEEGGSELEKESMKIYGEETTREDLVDDDQDLVDDDQDLMSDDQDLMGDDVLDTIAGPAKEEEAEQEDHRPDDENRRQTEWEEKLRDKERLHSEEARRLRESEKVLQEAAERRKLEDEKRRLREDELVRLAQEQRRSRTTDLIVSSPLK